MLKGEISNILFLFMSRLMMTKGLERIRVKIDMDGRFGIYKENRYGWTFTKFTKDFLP